VVLNRSDPIILFTNFSCEEITNKDSGCNNENKVHFEIFFTFDYKSASNFWGIFGAPLTNKGWEPLVYMLNTVKPVYNYHYWDPKIVSVVNSWSLFRGYLRNKSYN
jgi:hypothetical protein